MNQKELGLLFAVLIGGIIISALYFLPPPGSSSEAEYSKEVSSNLTSASAIPSPEISKYETTSLSESVEGSETLPGTPKPPDVVSTPVPGSDSIGTPFLTPTPSPIRTTTVTTSPAATGPPSFTLIVTPVEVRAKPGDAILYVMAIEPMGGFDESVSLRLEVNALLLYRESFEVNALLLYRESFDLGDIDPPFPKTIEYRFVVPSEVPGGITVKGHLTAEGGGHKEEQDLILQIGG